MAAGIPFNAVRRRAALCVALWAVAFFGCSVHCAFGGQIASAADKAHACCAQTQGKSQSPKSCCSGMPQIAATSTTVLKVDFTPQIVALVVPILSVELAADAQVAPSPPRPNPDIGPPSHVPLMRLAGRAPPTLV